jgi:membrane protein DedA with SNARE-associated domain
MNDTIEFLVRHGYATVFGMVFVEQVGVPLPAIPILLAAGALAGAGHLALPVVVALAFLAAFAADLIWYELGRRRGMKLVELLCRISLEPDSCVRKTEGSFARHGARSLLIAKFVPGLSTVAPPLAGVFRVRFVRFAAFDAAGALLWVGTFVGLGFVFQSELERIAVQATALGSSLFAIVLGGLGLWIAARFLRRQLFLRELRIARITPEELKSRLDAGEDLVVVDLRHSMEFEADPELIPGARRIDAARLEESHEALPREREIVLYCT